MQAVDWFRETHVSSCHRRQFGVGIIGRGNFNDVRGDKKEGRGEVDKKYVEDQQVATVDESWSESLNLSRNVNSTTADEGDINDISASTRVDIQEMKVLFYQQSYS